MSLAWTTKALNEVRRGLAAQLRRTGRADQATTIKHTRWALLKNPPDLTGDQRTTLAAIAKDNGALYRAYLLKEQLRMIFQAELPEASNAVQPCPGSLALNGSTWQRSFGWPARSHGP